MLKIVLYGRQDCHLCDRAKEDLRDLQELVPHSLIEIDIDTEPALQARYGDSIPVVEIGPYTLRAPMSKIDLKIALQAAQEGRREAPQRSEFAQRTAVSLNRIVYAFSKHWLAAFNLLVFTYLAVPFLAPMLLRMGAARPAGLIYKLYSPLCHQMAYRSWFLFGEQPVYPRELANTGYALTYEQVSGNDPADLRAARAFLGNDHLGYKVALCERDVAIYGGILLAGIAFAGLRKRLRPLPIPIWILLGVLPMALDGVIQLAGFLPIALPAYESTPFMRTLTGMLFGVMNVWLAYPYVEESMVETRTSLAVKLAGVSDDANQSSPD